ncbi:MAG: MBL fold metallo-hydrolase [Zhaonellaceae bacterium]|jgi:phosphoribosyl 1,2-cyclic phosphodiesterase
MSIKFFTLASGSSGNAVYVGSEKSGLLIDAGLTGKDICEKLAQNKVNTENLEGILVTHEHRDHIKGVGVMSRKLDLPVFATEGTWQGMKQSVGKIAEKNQKYLEVDNCLEIGDLKVEVAATSHDAQEPVAFTIHQGELSVGLATDTGQITRGLRKNITGCTALVLEANHDPTMLRRGPYPAYLKKRIASVMGHLSNQMSGEALAEFITGKTEQVTLAHLSEQNNIPSLALETVKQVLQEKGFDELPEIKVAPRYKASKASNLA